MTHLEGDRRPSREDLEIRSGTPDNNSGTQPLPQIAVGDYYFEAGTSVLRQVISEKVVPIIKHLS